MKQAYILIMLIGLACLTGCGCSKKEQNLPLPKDDSIVVAEEVVKDQEISSFTFKNTSIVYTKGESTLETTVTNISDEEQKLVEFKITLMNGEDVICELVGFVGSTFTTNESKVITSKTSKDVTAVTKIIYEVIH